MRHGTHHIQACCTAYTINLGIAAKCTEHKKGHNVASDSERNAVMRVAAESWFRLEGYSKALQYITAYAKGRGANMSREDNYLLGYTAYRTADYASAIEPLKAVCNGTDDLAQNASYHLADCYIRLGDKRNAIHAFAMAADERYRNEIEQAIPLRYLQYQASL